MAIAISTWVRERRRAQLIAQQGFQACNQGFDFLGDVATLKGGAQTAAMAIEQANAEG